MSLLINGGFWSGSESLESQRRLGVFIVVIGGVANATGSLALVNGFSRSELS
jgi:hypothetical protein